MNTMKPQQRPGESAEEWRHRRACILSIAEQLVAGQVTAGKLELDDLAALKAAVEVAVNDASAVFDAAMDFLCK
jgi:hypothetical protein